MKFKILGKEWEREKIFLACTCTLHSSLVFYMLKEAYFLETGLGITVIHGFWSHSCRRVECYERVFFWFLCGNSFISTLSVGRYSISFEHSQVCIWFWVIYLTWRKCSRHPHPLSVSYKYTVASKLTEVKLHLFS